MTFLACAAKLLALLANCMTGLRRGVRIMVGVLGHRRHKVA